MSDSNFPIEELAALKALNLLDDAGQRELRQAVERDPKAGPLVRDFAEMAAELAYEAPPVEPPTRVKREIMRQLPARNRDILPFASWIPYAIAACLMLLGIVQAWRISRLHAELQVAREKIVHWQWQVTEDSERKSFAELRVVPLDPKDPTYGAAKIYVAWNPHLHEGVVTLLNLSPPQGHDYQLWVLDPREPTAVSAGLLTASNGSQKFAVHPVQTDGPGFAVSLEPSGGRPTPTGPILFAVAPVE